MRISLGYILPLAWLCGCTSDGDDTSRSAAPYQLGQALVIGESSEARLVSVDATCESEACRAVIERCREPAYAEVIVAEDGTVFDVVCFRGNASFQEIGPDAVATASAGNRTVLVFDDLDDGADVTGNVVLTGNNAVIYGHGADVSRIGGDLAIDKNNAVVRGVSIGGDVRIEKNNAQLSFVEIFGDLTIAGNNTTLAGSTVHGQVFIDGVNTVLVQNRFFAVTQLAGKNLDCNGNVAVSRGGPTSDAGAGPGDADVEEVEAPISCQNEQGPSNGGR